jgi:hypothetical protein
MLLFINPCGRFIGGYVGSNCFWPVKDVSWLGACWQLMSIVKDHMAL